VDLRFHYANLAKHNVSPEEVEECFADPGKILRAASGCYWLVAKTQSGRFVEIGFVRESEDSGFVFHAMDAKPFQRRQYKRRAK
jgi:uncharacterized protein